MSSDERATGKPSGWNRWIRQTHRWLSIVFTLTVIVCFVAVSQEAPAEWIFYLPLLPLALLFLTGAYMFVLPYASRWRRGPGAGRTD